MSAGNRAPDNRLVRGQALDFRENSCARKSGPESRRESPRGRSPAARCGPATRALIMQLDGRRSVVAVQLDGGTMQGAAIEPAALPERRYVARESFARVAAAWESETLAEFLMVSGAGARWVLRSRVAKESEIGQFRNRTIFVWI